MQLKAPLNWQWSDSDFENLRSCIDALESLIKRLKEKIPSNDVLGEHINQEKVWGLKNDLELVIICLQQMQFVTIQPIPFLRITLEAIGVSDPHALSLIEDQLVALGQIAKRPKRKSKKSKSSKQTSVIGEQEEKKGKELIKEYWEVIRKINGILRNYSATKNPEVLKGLDDLSARKADIQDEINHLFYPESLVGLNYTVNSLLIKFGNP